MTPLYVLLAAAVIGGLAIGLAICRARLTYTRTTLAETRAMLTARMNILATTSHEIRHPLGGIMGMTQLLLADRRLDATVRERIEIIHQAGETMKSLVDDILDCAKTDAGELVVVNAEVELRPLLIGLARLWAGRAETKGVALNLAIDAAPVTIMSDAMRLRQIVGNLLANAVKFTSDGTIHVSVAVNDQRIAISVKDSGIGIAPDRHARIFEPYRQADDDTAGRYGGTGLGLAIAQRSAVALGGTIAVESKLGNGACFTLDLPLTLPDAAPCSANPCSAAPAATFAASTLLCVEPNPLRQSAMRALFASAAGTVAFVPDLASAAARIGETRVDHLLCSMDAADEEAIRLVATARTSGARVTLLHDRSTDADHYVADQCLVRPIAGRALVAAMRSLYQQDITADAADPVCAAA